MTTTPGIRVGPLGLRWRGRAALVAALLLVGLVGCGVFALVDGTLTVPLDRVWAALTGSGSRIEQLVVVDRRLTRALGAVLIGFALGVAGALTQSITRNPIASPDILGITTGASVVAVLVATQPAVLAGRGISAVTVLTPAALAGGLVTTLVVLGLAWRGGFDGMRLVLVGVGVNAVGQGLISWLLTRTTGGEAAIAVHWMTGSLDGLRPIDLITLVPAAVLGVVASLVLSRDLGALRLGRDVASGLGTPPGRTEAWSLAVAVALACVATAAAGPVAFVAFVAPQASLRLFRTAGPTPLASGLVGAALLLVSDVVAQRLWTPLPVGIVTAVVGAPFLLYLLTRNLRRTSV